MIPDVLEQSARPLLDRVVVVRDERINDTFGGVIDDADYLMANLIAVGIRSVRDRIITARMILRFIFCQDAAAVAVFLILVVAFDQPDLFGFVIIFRDGRGKRPPRRRPGGGDKDWARLLVS